MRYANTSPPLPPATNSSALGAHLCGLKFLSSLGRGWSGPSHCCPSPAPLPRPSSDLGPWEGPFPPRDGPEGRIFRQAGRARPGLPGRALPAAPGREPGRGVFARSPAIGQVGRPALGSQGCLTCARHHSTNLLPAPSTGRSHFTGREMEAQGG